MTEGNPGILLLLIGIIIGALLAGAAVNEHQRYQCSTVKRQVEP